MPKGFLSVLWPCLQPLANYMSSVVVIQLLSCVQLFADAPEDAYELIFNSELLDLKRDVEREGYSIILGKNPYQRHALADLDGNLLTDYEFFGGMKANYGLIEAEKISEDSN